MKRLLQLLIVPVLLFPFSVLQSAHLSYVHGFGEKNREKSASFYYEKFGSQDGGYSMVIVPDEAGQISSAVFYTQPAVEAVINDWHQRVCIEKNDSLIVVGYSCGGGTVINSLAKLVEYAACDGSKGCFDGTAIQSAQQAQEIIDAINNGAIVLNAPLLDVKKIRKITDLSLLLKAGTRMAATFTIAYSCGLTIGNAILLDCVLQCVIGSHIQKMYAAAIARFYLPRRTNGHFDPTYSSPLKSIDALRGKFSCPMLLHFNKNDGVVADSDEDTQKLCDAIENKKTHVLISTDAHHEKSSKQFVRALEMFKSHYFGE